MREPYRSKRPPLSVPGSVPPVSDAVVLGLAGIAVSGVLGPGVAAWWTHRRQVADHRHANRQEARDVMDDAARKLARAVRLNELMFQAWGDGHFAGSGKGEQALQAVMETVEEVRYTETRLTLRLGRGHPVESAYITTTLVLTDQFNPLLEAYFSGQAYSAWEDRAHKAVDDFGAETQRFLAAAKAYLDSE